jgi:hypothetical protein
MWRSAFAVTAAISVSACASNDDDTVDRQRCEQVRDHLIDLRLSSARRFPTLEELPAPSGHARARRGGPVLPQLPRTADVAVPPASLDAHRRAMRDALGESFVATCEQTLTAAQVRCALEATDTAAASACSRPSSQAPRPQTAAK